MSAANGSRAEPSVDTVNAMRPPVEPIPIEAAKELLLNAKPKFPKEAAIKYNLACYFCQAGDIKIAKSYLKKALKIDLNLRMAALEDVNLKPLWESL